MPGTTPSEGDPPGNEALPEAFEALRLSRITVGGITMRVRDGGSGPPLLLLHGDPETHLAWPLVAGALARAFKAGLPGLPADGHRRQAPSPPRHPS